MVDKTPAGITPGTANRGSVVHASDASLGNLSRSHTEEGISRLQSAMNVYSASLTYEVGDIVKEGAFFLRCITQITVPEAFDETKWELIDNGLGVFLVSYDLDSPDDNEFFVMNGGATSGDVTEADATAPSPGTFTTFQYTLNVTANSRGVVTNWQTRVNGADANGSITIPAGLTGVFQDLTNFDDHVVGDLICYQYDEPGGGGGLTLNGSSCGVRRTDE